MPEKAEETTESQPDESVDTTDWKAEADKWKALARKHEGQAKKNLEELEQLRKDQDASKSDMEKLQESVNDLQKRAVQAEREALVAKVAQAKKLPAAIANRLTGSTQEELEEDADQLIDALGLDSSETDDETTTEESDEETGGGRPREKLAPGASNEGDEAPDYEAIAKSIAEKNRI